MTVDPMLPFDQLIATHDGVLEVAETWNQGRGAFGGYVTGAMVKALEASAPDRPLRSLTAELCGPLVAGPAQVEMTVLRAGNAVTTTAIRLVQHGEVQAHGVGVLGKERVRDRDRTIIEPPKLPAWRDVPVAPIHPPQGPELAQHWELRIVRGIPFTGATEPLIEGWVRAERPGAVLDAAYLAGCIDCYYPTVFVTEKVPRPMATIAFTFQPLVHAGDPTAPLMVRCKLVAIDSGYCVEMRELWNEAGELVALNQQTFVIIK
ncbi:MAG TPA: thioesterase family protein [Kofleriaceae bacterium]